MSDSTGASREQLIRQTRRSTSWSRR